MLGPRAATASGSLSSRLEGWKLRLRHYQHRTDCSAGGVRCAVAKRGGNKSGEVRGALL
jgi:hypothetical protein